VALAQGGGRRLPAGRGTWRGARQRLQAAIAPKLRAKGAPDAIRLQLLDDDDAVSGALVTEKPDALGARAGCSSGCRQFGRGARTVGPVDLPAVWAVTTML
jgi:hypothetical protein